MKTQSKITKAFRNFTAALTVTAATLLSAHAGEGGTILEIVVYDTMDDATALISMLDTVSGSDEFRRDFDLTDYGVLPPFILGGEVPTEKPQDDCARFVKLAQATSQKIRELDRYLGSRGLGPISRNRVVDRITDELSLNRASQLWTNTRETLDQAARSGEIGMGDYNDSIRPGARSIIQNSNDNRDLMDRAQAMLDAWAECEKQRK
jgi:hypothetical protein